MTEPKCTCNLPRHNEKDHDPGCAIFWEELHHLLTSEGELLDGKADEDITEDKK